MNVYDLPPVNATLNALSTFFILMGVVAIKREAKTLHIFSMVAALTTSAIFLTCYLVYHFNAKVTIFAHPGWPKVLYYFILIPHTLMAMVSLPLIIMTVVPALKQNWERHRKVARWSWPIWLYVSVTGVLVYFMLYVWFPSPRSV